MLRLPSVPKYLLFDIVGHGDGLFFETIFKFQIALQVFLRARELGKIARSDYTLEVGPTDGDAGYAARKTDNYDDKIHKIC